MNRDEFRGAQRHLRGRAQSTIGGITGDPVRQVRGAVDQIAGGAQYAYGQVRGRADDMIEDSADFAHKVGRRGEQLLDDGNRYAREVRRRGETYSRQAIGYADENRTATLLALAAVAFATGWLLRSSR